MSPPESPQPASPPFDNDQADLILRSTDGVDFHVFKTILSLASQPLADKVNNSEDEHDGVRVVKFAQDSKVLDFVLRHLYPVPPPATVTLPDVRLLAEFAEDFEVNALESMIVRYLKDALEGDPIGVYSIAVTYDHKDIAAKAARLSLQSPISALQSSELEVAIAEPYSELIKYHAACGNAASAVAFDRKWFPPWGQWGRLIWTSNHDGSSNIRCSNCAAPDFVNEPPVQFFWPQTQDRDTVPSSDPLKRTRFAPWRLWNYLQRSSSVLAHHPTSKAVTGEDFVMKSPFDCSNCPLGTRENILEFSRIFAMEVEKAIEKVSVSIWFVGPAP
jgi:hypothetical protein